MKIIKRLTLAALFSILVTSMPVLKPSLKRQTLKRWDYQKNDCKEFRHGLRLMSIKKSFREQS